MTPFCLYADEPQPTTSTADDNVTTSDSDQEEVSSVSDGAESVYNPDLVTASMLQVLAQVCILFTHLVFGQTGLSKQCRPRSGSTGLHRLPFSLHFLDSL